MERKKFQARRGSDKRLKKRANRRQVYKILSKSEFFSRIYAALDVE